MGTVKGTSARGDSLRRFRLRFEEHRGKNQYGLSDDFLRKSAVDNHRANRNSFLTRRLDKLRKGFHIPHLVGKRSIPVNSSKNIKNIKTQRSRSLWLLTCLWFSFIMNNVNKSIERITNLCKKLRFIILKLTLISRLMSDKRAERKEIDMANKSNKNAEKPVENTKVKTKKSEKISVKNSDRGFMFGILGIAIALVIVSIAYSTAVILLGTKGLTPKIMLAPQVAFGVIVLGMAFSKIFK